MSRLARRWVRVAISLVFLWWAGRAATAQHVQDTPAPQYTPRVAPASDEGEQALRHVRIEPGLKLSLFAAEPLLANPVAIAIDARGRVFVAETFRLHYGVTDDRRHMDWLDDDLASRTVADRVAMYRKHLGEKFASYEVEHDRVRRLVDRDGDGRADVSAVLADGFRDAATGIGAGLLVRGRHIWYSCIPDLWLLTDADDDGRAEGRRALHTGYGVHVGFLGHDLHGLRFGPDGKLYFSIGDRGLHVGTEGRVLDYPDTGTVLRCNADGSELEVFASGLRNPQELAFDQFGNLFTGENNSDSGDKARWVYLVEGGDSGWRIGFQFITAPVPRGPWNLEKLWHPAWDGQAAYLVPPIANVGDGPSGLCFYPGTGLPARYRDHFFLADFRGASTNSGVRSFAVQPKGASFELIDDHQFLWGLQATDVDFGPDSALYVSDWVQGWDTTGKGRIYQASEAQPPARAAAEVQRLLGDGCEQRTIEQLTALLAHDDMRVRQEAQYALADRAAGRRLLDPAPPPPLDPQPAALAALARVAADSENLYARLHALWGLGQVARFHPAAIETLPALAADPQAEIRAQAIRVLGDARVTAAYDAAIVLARDENPRVRYFAAMALGKLGRPAALPTIVQLARDNADQDPYLRHAVVMALVGIGDRDAVARLAGDSARSVRLAAVVALRRLTDPRTADFLGDADPLVVAEAARAIHDVPIAAAMPRLAALVTRSGVPEPAVWRALNANFRLGQAAGAAALAQYAARADAPEWLRLEAVALLTRWAAPPGRDRVLGLWRPLAPRGTDVAVAALRPMLAGVLSGPEKVRNAGVQAAASLGIAEVGPLLVAMANDRSQSASSRIEAISALAELRDARLDDVVRLAIADPSPAVRACGQRLLARSRPADGVALLARVLEAGELVERQAAFATLGELATDAADLVLGTWLDKLLTGDVPDELRLDLLAASAGRPQQALAEKLAAYEAARPSGEPLAPFRETLVGGDAERGRRIFHDKAEVSCLRCHKVGAAGGDVGPDLSKLAVDKSREYLLESLVDPNRQIAKGYDTVVLATADGQVHIGILKAEDERQVRLITAEGKTVTVAAADIEERTRGQSAMPDRLAQQLSKLELRDLVEFLSTLK